MLPTTSIYQNIYEHRLDNIQLTAKNLSEKILGNREVTVRINGRGAYIDADPKSKSICINPLALFKPQEIFSGIGSNVEETDANFYQDVRKFISTQLKIDPASLGDDAHLKQMYGKHRWMHSVNNVVSYKRLQNFMLGHALGHIKHLHFHREEDSSFNRFAKRVCITIAVAITTVITSWITHYNPFGILAVLFGGVYMITQLTANRIRHHELQADLTALDATEDIDACHFLSIDFEFVKGIDNLKKTMAGALNLN